MRTAVLLFFLVSACSNNVGRSDAGDAGDAVDTRDTIDARDTDMAEQEADPDAEEDPGLDPEAPDFLPDPFETDPILVDCTLPIRDCGPGCRQVTCAAYPQNSWSWDVEGSIIVYYARVPDRAGPYMKDLITGEEKRLAEYPNADWSHSLSVFDEKIAFSIYKMIDPPGCESILNVYDLAHDSIEMPFCFSNGGVIYRLDMYNDIIVWYGLADDGLPVDLADLFTYDLGTMTMTRLTERQNPWDPMIWGRQFVYTWGDSESFEIFLWDLETSTTRNITNDPADQWQPDIWENRVVWMDHRNSPGGYYNTSNTDVYWCDLPVCEAFPATTDGALQEVPTVEGDWIAWSDYRNDVNPNGGESSYHDNLEIWGYNISTGMEYRLMAFDEEILWGRFKIVGGKLYFKAPTSPHGGVETDAIFELDLSQFL